MYVSLRFPYLFHILLVKSNNFFPTLSHANLKRITSMVKDWQIHALTHKKKEKKIQVEFYDAMLEQSVSQQNNPICYALQNWIQSIFLGDRKETPSSIRQWPCGAFWMVTCLPGTLWRHPWNGCSIVTNGDIHGMSSPYIPISFIILLLLFPLGIISVENIAPCLALTSIQWLCASKT